MATVGKAITAEESNFYRLVYLCHVIGLEEVRSVFDSLHPHLEDALSRDEETLKNKLGSFQITKLFPRGQPAQTSEDFDLTLLLRLLREMNPKVKRPPLGFYRSPDSQDKSDGACIARIMYRRKYLANLTTWKIADGYFNKMWIDLAEVNIRQLYIALKAINSLKESRYKTTINEAKPEFVDWSLEDVFRTTRQKDVIEHRKYNSYNIKIQETNQGYDGDLLEWKTEIPFPFDAETVFYGLISALENKDHNKFVKSKTGAVVIIARNRLDPDEEDNVINVSMAHIDNNLRILFDLSMVILIHVHILAIPGIGTDNVEKPGSVIITVLLDFSTEPRTDNVYPCNVLIDEITFAFCGSDEKAYYYVTAGAVNYNKKKIKLNTVRFDKDKFPEVHDHYKDIMRVNPNLQTTADAWTPSVRILYDKPYHAFEECLVEMFDTKRPDIRVNDYANVQAIICMMQLDEETQLTKKDKHLLLMLKVFYRDVIDNVIFVARSVSPTKTQKFVKLSKVIAKEIGMLSTHDNILHRLFFLPEETTEIKTRLSLLIKQRMIDRFKEQVVSKQTSASIGQVDFRYHKLRMISRRNTHVRSFGYELRKKIFYATADFANIDEVQSFIQNSLEFGRDIEVKAYEEKITVDLMNIKSGDEILLETPKIPDERTMSDDDYLPSCGTAGFFLRDQDKQFVSTCKHVVGSNNPNSKISVVVQRDGKDDKIPCKNVYRAPECDFAVCQLDESLEFYNGIRNEDNGHTNGRVMTEEILVQHFDSISSVYKWGVETNLTKGNVVSIEEHTQDIIYHDIIIEGQSFGRHGDSGALVSYQKDNEEYAAFILKSAYNKKGTTEEYTDKYGDRYYKCLMVIRCIRDIKRVEEVANITECFER